MTLIFVHAGRNVAAKIRSFNVVKKFAWFINTVELPANKAYRVYCTSTCQNHRHVSQIWSLVCPISELIVKGRIRKGFRGIPWTVMPLLCHLYRRSSLFSCPQHRSCRGVSRRCRRCMRWSYRAGGHDKRIAVEQHWLSRQLFLLVFFFFSVLWVCQVHGREDYQERILRILYVVCNSKGAWRAQVCNHSWGMVVGTAVLCIWLVSDTVSYLVSDWFPFTKMSISKSSGI
jgi:hypothetical protein